MYERKKEESVVNTCRIQGQIMAEQTENSNLKDRAVKMKRLFGQH
jgi:hypothetical protein